MRIPIQHPDACSLEKDFEKRIFNLLVVLLPKGREGRLFHGTNRVQFFCCFHDLSHLFYGHVAYIRLQPPQVSPLRQDGFYPQLLIP